MPDPAVTETVVTPAVTDPIAAPWYAGIADQEVVGHLQTQGWDKLTPAEAVANAVKAARDNATFNGVPATELLRRPKAEDAAGTKAFWEALGAPKDAAGYDFSTVKFADGTLPDQAFTDFMRTTAAELNLPAPTAAQVASSLVKFMEAQDAAEAAETSAALQVQKDALTADWGANAEANTFIARQAAAKLGVDQTAIDALQKVVGFDKVMQMFLNIGTKIGEDKFVVNPNPSIPGVMSVSQAKAQKAELMKDDAFKTRFLAAEAAAVRQMQALDVLIAGETGQTYRAA